MKLWRVECKAAKVSGYVIAADDHLTARRMANEQSGNPGWLADSCVCEVIGKTSDDEVCVVSGYDPRRFRRMSVGNYP